jgi:hypothetical protein
MSIVALVLLACGSKDEGGGGGGGDDSSPPVTDDSAAPVDADRDGVTEADDCDENDPTVHPGAKEICNNRDDDCDNETDEGLLVPSYADEDADGYGDDATEEQVCIVPHDRASIGGDCDDHEQDVHPDADEVCDKLDNDCDLLVDDEDELDEGDDWYLDEDGDGYGGDKGILTCEDPGKGWDNVSTDCDDADRHVFPGAVEVCRNGVVEDCNRTSGDAFAYCNGDTVGESMADVQITLGSEQTIAWSDLTGDGTTDVVLGASIEDSLENGAYVFTGPLAGDLDADDALAFLTPSAKNLGVVNVATGSYDGDAQDDLVVGTPVDFQAGNMAGAVYVVLGPVTSAGSLSDADLVVLGDDANGRLGSSVQLVADSTGDGAGELLVAAGGADGDNEEEGAVWILEGGTFGSATAADLALAEIRGMSAAQRLGAGAAAGDLTGDGVEDLVVGNGEHTVQVAYIFVGPVSGTMTSDDADVDINGAATDFGFGLSPLVVDLDGDGAQDVIVTAYDSSVSAEHGGRVLAWSGPLDKSVDDSTAMLDIEGAAPGDYVGGSVQATDIDGDAVLDLVVQGGVHWTVGSSGGSADSSSAGWVFFGPVDGTLDSASSDIEITDATGDRFAVVAPDVDGDGRVELAWDTEAAVTHFVNLDGY